MVFLAIKNKILVLFAFIIAVFAMVTYNLKEI